MGLNYFDQPFAWDVQTNIQKHQKIRNFMSTDAWSNLDKVDQKILEILNKNARTPSKEIATDLRINLFLIITEIHTRYEYRNNVGNFCCPDFGCEYNIFC